MRSRILPILAMVLAIPATGHGGATLDRPKPPAGTLSNPPARPPTRLAARPPAEAVDKTSVLRVNSTNQTYDFLRPWTKEAPGARYGLGVLIEGGRILVTAELVANSTYVELEKAATAEKAPAAVEVVDYDCNLAIVRPDNPDFLAGMKPLTLDEGVKIGDRAEILQLESNGDIARTAGTITSIVVERYPLDETLGLLLFRLSAPLPKRDGSFTLPAIREGRILGLLMRYDTRSQTADLVPAPVITHFLKEAAKKPYAGFARLGLAFASTRDPQFRRYLGLKEPGGVYVTDVLAGGSAEKAGLKKGDIILAAGGHDIDQDGNYVDPEFGRISFSHITNTLSHPGDAVVFQIFRGGKVLEATAHMEVRNRAAVLSEPYVIDRAPRFVILGGLVFLELSRPYLKKWGATWANDAPQRLVHYDAFQNEFTPDRGKVVFLSQVLPTPDTLGYETLDHLVVSKLNGREIKSLDNLAEAAKYPVNGFQKIELEENPGVIFLDNAAVESNQAALIKEYALPALQRL